MATEIQKRVPILTKSFKVDGTFQSLYAAQKWLMEKGYECGSLCAQDPIALVKGDYNLPQKWKNFYKEDKNLVDGVITSNDFREAEVTVTLYN